MSAGAAEMDPVPVWVKNFFVVVVFPASRDAVFAADSYSTSPRVVIGDSVLYADAADATSARLLPGISPACRYHRLVLPFQTYVTAVLTGITSDVPSATFEVPEAAKVME